MTRLLILSCSMRKRLDPALLPALDRYDGPAFRVLRRYLREDPVAPPRVYVLSAKFGLIPGDRPIPWYDLRMTPDRAALLRPSVHETLVSLIVAERYKRVFVAAGRDYRAALPLDEATAAGIDIAFAHGQPGRKLAQLKGWLEGGTPAN